MLPSFLGPLNTINQRLAEEQLRPYLYLKPREPSTTVAVSSSSGILNPPHHSQPPHLAKRKFQIHQESCIRRRRAAHQNARNGIQTSVKVPRGAHACRAWFGLVCARCTRGAQGSGLRPRGRSESLFPSHLASLFVWRVVRWLRDCIA
jgi:hypothetical protein